MSTNWKQSIISFLNDNNEKELKTQLRTEWIDIYPEDKSEIYKFLYYSKLQKLFTYLFAIDLQSQIIELPWVLILKLITSNKVSLPKGHLKELNKNLHKQKFITQEHNDIPATIKDLNAKKRYFFIQKMMKAKQELIASARIAQSEQLMDQHVHYMNELRKMAPSEYSVTTLISEQEKQKAEKILSKRSKFGSTYKQREVTSLSQEEKVFIESLSEQASQYLTQNKARPSDFAYLFRSMGEHQKAIDFVYLNKDVATKDWQLLDYLFSGKQYLTLLDHCQELKEKYSGYPDSLFSISYAEAIAYWELGEKETAVNLMEQISAMRPGFKSATERLSQWKEDSFE